MTYVSARRLYESKEYKNRFLSDVLPDKSWKGKSCFIIGGGPSLEKFNWKKLKGKRVIGVNRAYEKFDPTIIFSMDTRFLLWVKSKKYGDPAYGAFEESKAYKVWLLTYKATLPKDFFIVPVYKNYNQGHYAFTDSMNDGIGHGNNSGYGALNLAFCLKAKIIHLLGFDLKHTPAVDERGMAIKKSHWHTGHPMPQFEDDVVKFRHYYVRIADKIKKAGVKVINLNPDSALECFEKKHPDEIFN